MGSRIPLPPMPHKIDTYRLVEGDDGFGGISTMLTIVNETVRCRITEMTGEDKQKEFGNAAGRKWKIISKYMTDLLHSDMVGKSAKSVKTVLTDETKLYRVIWERPQIDDLGKFHHHSMIVELEDGMSVP